MAIGRLEAGQCAGCRSGVGYWQFNEAAGTQALDTIGAHHATLYGAVRTAGNRTWVMDGRRSSLTLAYDALHRLTAATDPLGSTWTWPSGSR